MEKSSLGESISEILDSYLTGLGVSGAWVYAFRFILFVSALFAMAAIFRYLASRFMIQPIRRIVKLTRTDLDDFLLNKQLVGRIIWLIPVLVYYPLERELLLHMHSALGWIGKIADIYLIMIMALIIQAFVGGLFNWLARIPAYEDKPLNSYRQLLAIVNFGVAIILSISVIIEKSPLYLLSALGALTAVLLLVFRDSLLGLTASIQISTNDIVRNGDWITFEDYGADGNVTDINLTTIKVRNFDNTFTTVPTYAFISNSFKNWRGMQESGGRRIKRSILIDLMSIRFADEDLLGRLKEVDLLLPYIHERLEDIKTHNEKTVKNANATANGRRLTNIGLFRHYVQAYVEANPYINRNMVCMVRQLEPSAQGLPIEIYAFSREKDWPLYESIMADIFDHLFAVVTHFELRIFQQPSGTDFHNIGKA